MGSKLILIALGFSVPFFGWARSISLPKVKAEIHKLVADKNIREIEKHLGSDFKTSFGELKDQKTKFLEQVTTDKAFRAEFLRILDGKCGVDETGVDICPESWLKCKEDDPDCGSQLRLGIDLKSSPWKIRYYIAGD